jgi:crotonobetainyl-CoA:carnitine CoA-transferase CaiB-like acyl-CoA transferase
LPDIKGLDRMLGEWVAARTLGAVLEEFERADAVAAPVYDMDMIAKDPTYEARANIIRVDDSELGPLRMQNVVPALSSTPGAVRWGGPALGAHNDEVYRGLLGLAPGEIDRLRGAGSV